MTGFVFAVPLTARDCTFDSLFLRDALFALCVVAHFTAIYAWNSYLGYANDELNARLVEQQKLKRSTFLSVAAVLSIGSIALYYFAVNATVALAGLLSIALWLWYSVPGFGLKEVPFAGTLLHLGSGTLHGVMALIAFRCFDAQHALVALWFGALFASGHLVHEAIDREADALAGVRTACVRYGYRAFALILVGYVPILAASACLLASSSATSMGFLAFVIAAIVHAALVWRVLWPMLWADVDTARRDSDHGLRFVALQRKYRMLYSAAGVIAAAVFLGS